MTLDQEVFTLRWASGKGVGGLWRKDTVWGTRWSPACWFGFFSMKLITAVRAAAAANRGNKNPLKPLGPDRHNLRPNW